METAQSIRNETIESEDFSRLDESDDREFYQTDRFVSHLDSLALATVERIVGDLVIEENPVILDLMAGWDSHIPKTLTPAGVVGLGLNENELKNNKDLTEFVFHDLNENPRLPFPDNTFDAVINTVSVDYMTQPVSVFEEVGRVLRPGGAFLVFFSNRMFPLKAVKVWKESSEEERVSLVEDFFHQARGFEEPVFFVSKGKPRPKDDKYAGAVPFSDPVYLVYAEKKGADADRKKRPDLGEGNGAALSKEELEQKKRLVKETLCCPHCDEKLRKWEVPDNPFCQTWDNDYMYICFNDECSYFERGWEHMRKNFDKTLSYRFMFNPANNACMPMPVPSYRALKEGIME